MTKTEALKKAGYKPVIGRPRIGNAVLDQITVPGDLKIALEAKAKALGISVPDARREAYRKFTE